jgi:triacylglycerol esterase/lipase EstA (alpha/beta hydrolase family)
MIILYEILSAIISLVVGFVIVSFTFCWYETANRNPSLINGRFKTSRLWLAFKLMIGEFISLCLILITNPFGWSNRPDRPASDQTGTPIILLHGLFHNRAAWFWFKFQLRRKGLSDVYTLNLPAWKDIETLTERVAMLVDELRHKRGIAKVHLIGHSMGGIIARNYVQIRGGAQKVDRCILLGTPNSGSKMVPFVVTNLGKNLMPGSAFLTNLNAQPIPQEVQMTNNYSRHDNLVLPFENAILDGATNTELTGVGHTSLLFHPAAFHACHAALTENHADD